MGALDIVVLVLVCVAFAGAAGWLIYRKVRHKGGCTGCDCGGCGAHCPHCRDKADKNYCAYIALLMNF